MVRKIFLQCRPGHPLLQLIHVVAAKFARRCKARGRDWVQSGRRSIGPSMDQGLDLLQLDQLAPTTIHSPHNGMSHVKNCFLCIIF